MFFDIVIVGFSYYFSFLIRFDGSIPEVAFEMLSKTLPFLLIITVIWLFGVFKVYRGSWQYSSINDLVSLILAVFSSTASFVVFLFLFFPGAIPRSIPIIYGTVSLILLGGTRFGIRLYREMSLYKGKNLKRVLIIGAGDAGEMIIRQMKGRGVTGYIPVGIIDDNPSKIGMSIHGVPVLGTKKEMTEISKEYRVGELIIATPSATGVEMREIIEQCEKTALPFKTVPGPREIVNGAFSISELRNVEIEDLLGREPINIDTTRLKEFLSKKTVLVTGAAGSIGSELCRQIIQFYPEHIIFFDKTENSLFHFENEIIESIPAKVRFSTIIGDVIDLDKLEYVINHFHPQIIFHAAAHKHVPLMELSPEEAVKNNVAGTINVTKLADKFQVEKLVLISTDKAVSPTSVMGASKRVAELYIQGYYQNLNTKTRFITVRFGNVLGSNGSVVPLFKQQIKEKKPITVTDPEMTRFFMTIQEAVQLITQAAAMGEGGEIFILNMGEPIKIIDMARHLITLSGLVPEKDIAIKIVGRRPGEKIHEELWNGSETPQPTLHHKILMAKAASIKWNSFLKNLEKLLHYAKIHDKAAIIHQLQEIIPDYQPSYGISTIERSRQD